MKRFIITLDQQVKVWQNNVHEVEADTEEQAKQLIKDNPTMFCIRTETLHDTEEVIDNDFENNFEIHEKIRD